MFVPIYRVLMINNFRMALRGVLETFHLFTEKNTTTIGSIYTWRTLTGVKLHNNRTQYSRPAIFFVV